MEDEQEMGYVESNCHMTDDVTWPQKVKVVIQILENANISKTMRGRVSVPIGNSLWRIECTRDRWHYVTLKGQGRDPIMFED